MPKTLFLFMFFGHLSDKQTCFCFISSLHLSCNRTCQPGQYGVNCNQTCSCHDKICDPVSGACYLRKKILVYSHAHHEICAFFPPNSSQKQLSSRCAYTFGETEKQLLCACAAYRKTYDLLNCLLKEPDGITLRAY